MFWGKIETVLGMWRRLIDLGIFLKKKKIAIFITNYRNNLLPSLDQVDTYLYDQELFGGYSLGDLKKWVEEIIE
mgnify:CR=1 FL=1